MTKKFDLTELAEENIDAANTANLRGWADAAKLSDWSVRTTVATFKLDTEVITTAMAMTQLDKTVQVLLTAYRDRGAKVSNRYGDVEVTVYQDDESLRHALRRERAKLIEAAEAKDTEE